MPSSAAFSRPKANTIRPPRNGSGHRNFPPTIPMWPVTSPSPTPPTAYDRAAPLLASLVSKNPQDAELHYALGSALMHQHRYADAQSQLLEAVRLQPAQPGPYGDLAVAANENKNYPLVIKGSLIPGPASLPRLPPPSSFALLLMITSSSSSLPPRTTGPFSLRQVASILIRSGRRSTA